MILNIVNGRNGIVGIWAQEVDVLNNVIVMYFTRSQFIYELIDLEQNIVSLQGRTS